MAISVFPAPSTASAPYPGAGSVVASSAETKGFYSTTLAAGNYIINVLGGGNVVYDVLRNTYSVSAYESNILHHQPESGVPTFVKITTSDTIFISANNRMGKDYWTYYFNGTSASDDVYGLNYASVKNCDWTKNPIVLGAGGNGHINCLLVPLTNAPSTLATGVNDRTEIGSQGQVWINNTEAPIVYATFTDRYYVVRSNGAVYTSTNAASWGTVTLTGASGLVRDMCYGSFNGYYVFVTDSGTSTSNISSSTNGTTWSTRTGALSQAMYSVTVGNNLYIAVGNGGGIQTSTDSITWTSRTSPQTGIAWTHVAYNSTNGYYFLLANGISSNISAAYSTDAITWTGVLPVVTKASETIATTHNSIDYRRQVGILGTTAVTQNSRLFSGGGYFYVVSGEDTYVSAIGDKWNLLSGRQTTERIYHPTYGLVGWRKAARLWSWLHPMTASYVIYNSTI